MRALLTAAVLAVSCSASAATFTLGGVVLGNLGDSLHQEILPQYSVTGSFILDGPFSNASVVSDYSLTFTSLTSTSAGSTITIAPPLPQFWIPNQNIISDATTTRITLTSNTTGIGMLLPVGRGTQISTGVIPFIVKGDGLIDQATGWPTYSASQVGAWGATVMSGWLTVSNDAPATASPASVPTVPEPSTWLALVTGVLMVGFAVNRRKQSC